MWSNALRKDIRLALGDAFLAGPWDEAGLRARALEVLAIPPRATWLAPLVHRTLEAYRERPGDRRRELHAWLDAELWKVSRRSKPPAVVGRLIPVAEMGRMRWPVPEIATLVDLAAHLDLHVRELDWLADVRSLERTVPTEALRHYRYRWVPRAGGTPRLLECPKRHLKELQRRVLHEILDTIPPHPDAHGFRRGHSARTNARRHTGHEVVIGFDLEDFFATIEARRVYGIFRAAGYPETVAHRLTGLCTNVVPRAEWDAAPVPNDARHLARHHRLGRRLATPHLPQGAPTSPAIANLAAYGLDRRLSALAAASGAFYSRYADDVTFSGGEGLLACAPRFRRLVAEIVADEGFRLNERKSRLTTRAGCQVVTGVVVNDRTNLARRKYDVLRATLRDAAINGPAQANRYGVADFRSHLLGKIVWAESLNPTRGAKLREAFAHIEW